MGKKRPELPDHLKEYRYPVGFSMKVHPTLRSPNPSGLPRLIYYTIDMLNQDSIMEKIRKITYSEEEIKRFRSPIQALIYSMIYRNITWNQIVKPGSISFLETLDYNKGTMYLHLDISIIYSNTPFGEYDWFTKETVENDFKEFVTENAMMNSLNEYYRESRYLECIALRLIGVFFKKESFYEEDSIWVKIPEYFFRYLSSMGFVRTNCLKDSMTFKRNNLFSFN